MIMLNLIIIISTILIVISLVVALYFFKKRSRESVFSWFLNTSIIWILILLSLGGALDKLSY